MKITRQEQLADHLTELDEDLLNNAYEIDDTEKLADYAKAKRTHAPKLPVFRRMAVLAACLMLTVATVFALPLAFSREEATTTPAVTTPAPEGDKIVLPPVRVGTKGYSQASFHERVGSIESLCEFVDAIAIVRIGNWLGEDSNTTFYDAEVLSIVAGTIPEHFTLLQAGNSRITMKFYPLYTHGDEVLVFLQKSTHHPEEGCSYPDNNSYWVAGCHTTSLEVVTDEEGNTYFVDRFYLIDRSSIELNDMMSDSSVYNTVNQVLATRDAEVIQFKAKYNSIYSLDELKAKIPQLTKGG